MKLMKWQRHPPERNIACLYAAVIAGCFLLPVAAPAAAAPPWQSLHFQQDSPLGGVTAELALQPVPTARGSCHWRLQVNASLGRHNREQVTLLLASPRGNILAKQRYSEGRLNRRFKSFDYAGGNILRQRREPAAGEHRLPHQQWSETSTESLALPELDAPLLTPYALPLLATAGELTAVGNSLTIYLHTDHNFYRATLSNRGRQSVAVRYRLQGEGGQLVDETVSADRIELQVAPVRQPEQNDFELMGLRDQVYFLVDRETRLPLRISGRIPHFGETHIDLSGASL